MYISKLYIAYLRIIFTYFAAFQYYSRFKLENWRENIDIIQYKEYRDIFYYNYISLTQSSVCMRPVSVIYGMYVRDKVKRHSKLLLDN